MTSSQESGDKTEEEEADIGQCWTLDTIPKELFLHICSFLSAKFVINVLSQVCEQFKCLIEDDATWRIRLHSRWPHRYPIIKSDNFSWKEACCEREEQYKLWRDNAFNMKMYHLKSAHFAAVDIVHIIENGQLCASGSRDHSIKLWNLNALNELPPESDFELCELSQNQIDAAHLGWIWSMTYSESNHTLYTGSWDSLVRSWDINDFNASKQVFGLRSPVLCLAYSQNILICGCYDGHVSFFDPRIGTHPLLRDDFHQKAVLCITADDKYVISGSEDHTVVVYNKVAGKVDSVVKLEGYPMSLSYAHNHLWVGDNLGFLNVIDPTMEKFEFVKSYPSGHRSQVTGVHYSLGSIITSSLDKSIRVLEPSGELKPITSFSFNCGVAGISTYKETVISANSDDSITIWMPKSSE